MPLNVALVLDHSGSMKGAKLKAVKDAVKLVMDQLAPTDFVSVVIFDDNVQVVVPAQQASNKDYIKQLVDGIRDGGGTAMSLGMNVGLTELRKFASPQTGQPHDPADRRRDLWRRRPLPPHRRRRGRVGHRHLSAGHRRRLG